MRKFMLMKKILLFLVSVFVFTSCYTTWTVVGDYTQLEKQGLKSYQYDKDKQFYLFGGLIPIGYSHARTPNEPCEIKSKFKFGDFLLSTITCDIVTSRTVYVYALEGGHQYPLSAPQQIEPQRVEAQSATPREDVAKAEKKQEKPQDEKKAKKQEEQAQPAQETEVATAPAEKEQKKQTEKTAEKEEEEHQDIVIVESPKEETQSQPAIIPAKESPIQPTVAEESNPVVEHSSTVATNETTPFAPKATKHTIIENGAIQAPFSVGEHKKIYFSKGNLQYQASSKKWRFAENQYDMIGADNAQVSPSNSRWIDLFGWATSGWDNGNTYYMPYNTETTSATNGYGYGPTNGQTYGISLKGAFAEADWGVANKIEQAGDSAGIWRTLSRAEWGYLLVKRPFADNLYSLATVENVRGMILLPDNWESVEGVTFVPTASYEKNVFSNDQWDKLEATGAVFLPSAGCRYGTTVGNAGTTGSYWSITADGDEKAWYFIFNKSNVDINSEFSRGLGRSVRLVKDVR